MARRRKFIKGIGAGTFVGLAGCSEEGNGGQVGNGNGDGPNTVDNEGDEFNPSRDTVEFITIGGADTSQNVLGSAWAQYVEDYYPDGVSTTVTNIPDQVTGQNELWNGDKNGGAIAIQNPQAFVTNEVNELAEWDTEQLVNEGQFVWRLWRTERGLQMGYHSDATQHVDDHLWFDDYYHLRDFVKENNLRAAVPSDTHMIHWELWREVEPEFGPDTGEWIRTDEQRPAILRGDAELYWGGYDSNLIDRTEFYFTQGAWASKETASHFADLTIEPTNGSTVDGLPDEYFFGDTEDYLDIVDQFGTLAYWAVCPPGTPEEVQNVHLEAAKAAHEDGAVRDFVTEIRGDLGYNPNFEEANEEAGDIIGALQDPIVQDLMDEHLL